MRSAPLLSALFIASLALAGAGGTPHSERWTGWKEGKAGQAPALNPVLKIVPAAAG